jgi:branched-chain amino acid aminotransferase
MPLESKYIWLNGKLVEFEKATVHFLNTSLHYGVGAFEGIRCYNTPKGPAIFRLTEHSQRLIQSAKVMGFNTLPYSLEEIDQATLEVVSSNGFKECYIRPLLYVSAPNLGLNLDSGTPQLGIAAWEWGSYLGDEALEKGIRANISSFTRLHPNVNMTKAKITGNYANSVLAKTESVRLGFDEAIMLDPQGYVGECSGENIFIVRNGKIFTPPTATILEGITRDTLMTIAKDLGFEIIEQPVSRDQLYIADEVFVCGSAAECVPICEIDFRVVGSGRGGPITRQIQKAFSAVIHGQNEKYESWLHYVP